MFKRSSALIALSAMLLTGVATPGAEARDGIHRHRHHPVKRIEIRSRVQIIKNRTVINIERTPRRHRQSRSVDTYSGDVAVYSRPGVGTWSYDTQGRAERVAASGWSAEIIDLQSGRNDCSMENGVCVIRP